MFIINFIIKFFDKLEDKIRRKLSKTPVIYALIGSVGIILLWRGIWYMADQFEFMTPLVSTVLGIVILLLIGLFVSFFVGEQIIISGMKAEKKTDEKTEDEIRAEVLTLRDIHNDIDVIKKKIDEICEQINLKK